MTKKIVPLFLFCPVPENQKPISEFLSFQQNSYFSRLFLKKNATLLSLVKFFFSIFALSFFLFYIFFSFSWSTCLFSIFFLNIVSFCIFFLDFLKLWEIQNLLNYSRVPYEEGSWYDFQIWEKPFSVLKHEKFINSQRIFPIFEKFFFPLILLFFLSAIVFFIIFFYIWTPYHIKESLFIIF